MLNTFTMSEAQLLNWLEKANLSAASYKSKKTILKSYLLPFNFYDYDAINKNIQNAQLKQRYKQTIVAQIKAFYNFLNANLSDNFIKFDSKKINNIEVMEPVERRAFTEEEKATLFKELDNLTPNKYIKEIKPVHKFIIKFLNSNACRISEAVEVLKQDNWHFDYLNNCYFINARAFKGGNVRKFWLTPELYEDYKQIDKKAFVVRTLQGFFTAFQNHLHNLEGVKFTAPLTAHAFRTNYITNAVFNGFTTEQIASVTGHKKLETINDNYIKPNSSIELKNAMNIARTIEMQAPEEVNNLNNDLLITLIKQVQDLKNEIKELKGAK
ncbi:site-specific integrase [Mycoplasmopsis columboralis]|uniref:Phage integrase family n=1 Tax=Mycoplasmopsis columboralis TaxID=171282 RepID=A0A449B5X2_9BACT|nr:site-specific integrase [Mycoplasmopsis columboralis]VEU75972.1 Phage integrase family [Mycoplasmopsis columboralis]